jgi:2-polyprenyl-6-methoxyphenol hydroxylase-like FAD-dependent oxidoreductase
MLSATDPVLIVGGGLGGLSMALALGRKGQPVVLLEQTPELGAIGYGIQLGPNVFHMFDRLGIGDAVKAVSEFPPAAVWLDAYSGREITRVVTDDSFLRRFGHPYIIIHRVDLPHVLRDACRSLSNIEFAPSATVIDFEDNGDHVVALTEDGRRFRGRLLIGADGLRSRIRARLKGDREPRLIGWVAHRTIVPIAQAPAGVDTGVVALWGGEGFHIVHYPLRKGSVFNIVAVFRTPTYAERGDVESYRAELLKTYANAHPLMRAMIAMMDLERRWPIADRDPVRGWSKGRIVLLGDAVHPTLQSLAQGACMAIEDAVCLAEMLELAGDDFATAFVRYEAERFRRTSRIVYESRYLWKMYHAEGPRRAEMLAPFQSRSHDEVWDRLAWIYDGYQPPAAQR